MPRPATTPTRPRRRVAATLTAVLALGVVGAACSSGGSEAEVDTEATILTGGFIAVTDPWTSPTAPGQTDAALAMDITTVDGDRLVGASVAPEVAAGIELVVVDGAGTASTTSIQPADDLDLDVPPGGTAQLAPDGDRLVLTGLVRPLQLGETVTVTLEFEVWGSEQVDVPVQQGRDG